jgi:hypothetical protein
MIKNGTNDTIESMFELIILGVLLVQEKNLGSNPQ